MESSWQKVGPQSVTVVQAIGDESDMLIALTVTRGFHHGYAFLSSNRARRNNGSPV
jgi:hypothetical protein